MGQEYLGWDAIICSVHKVIRPFYYHLLITSLESEPWRELSPDLADVIGPLLDDLAAEIIEAIASEIPEYQRPLEGSFGRGVHRGVGEALSLFVALIRDADAARRMGREVYVELGRGELSQGRTLDALLSAYRIGARVAWRSMAAAVIEAGVDRATMGQLAESVFAYIDELSADSAEGFAVAQSELREIRLQRRLEVVSALLRPDPPSLEDLQSISRAADWRLPERAAPMVCHETDLAEITRHLPVDVISAPVDGFGCLMITDPDGPGRLRQLRVAAGEMPVVLGTTDEVRNLADSWTLAKLAFSAAGSGRIPSGGLIRVDEHLVDLVVFRSRDLIGHLDRRYLAPLKDLTPKSRQRLTETAISYIDHQGNAVEMARELHIHPQSARYRMARLRELLGEGLDDPEARFAIELSLRGARDAGP